MKKLVLIFGLCLSYSCWSNTIAWPPSKKATQVHHSPSLSLQKASKRYTIVEHKLLAAKPNEYTIQLTPPSSEQHTRHILIFEHLDNSMYLYVNANKQKGYIIVKGIYPTLREAYEEMKTLPRAIKKLKPQIHQVNIIQAMIRETHRA